MSRHKKDMINNSMWNAIERFGLIGIQLICTFILGRFLNPEDFGIVALLVVFTFIGNTITESGFSQALIREKDVKDITYNTVFYTNVFISIILYVILFFSSDFIADYYHQPILKDISKITFLVIPLNAFSLIQTTKCTINLEFKKMCIIIIISSLTSCTFALLYAYFYKNVWALVFQNVLTYAIKSILLWCTSKWKPSLTYSFSEIKRLFVFSRNLLISGIIGNIFNNIYIIITGRYYATTEVAFLSQADRIRQVASASTTQVIQGVSYPILSSINNNGGDVLSAYKKIIILTLTLVGFGMALLMGISEDLLALLMGNEIWRKSGYYLYILGISGILFPLHAVNQNILLVKGKGNTVLWLEIVRRSIMVLIIIFTLQFEVEIFIWGYAFYSFVLVFINLYVCGKPIGYTLTSQLKDIYPSILSFIIMLSVSYLCNFLTSDFNVYLRLTCCVICSASIGLLLLWSRIKEVIFFIIKKE